jgi:hypothetical protein
MKERRRKGLPQITGITGLHRWETKIRRWEGPGGRIREGRGSEPEHAFNRSAHAFLLVTPLFPLLFPPFF